MSADGEELPAPPGPRSVLEPAWPRSTPHAAVPRGRLHRRAGADGRTGGCCVPDGGAAGRCDRAAPPTAGGACRLFFGAARRSPAVGACDRRDRAATLRRWGCSPWSEWSTYGGRSGFSLMARLAPDEIQAARSGSPTPSSASRSRSARSVRRWSSMRRTCAARSRARVCLPGGGRSLVAAPAQDRPHERDARRRAGVPAGGAHAEAVAVARDGLSGAPPHTTAGARRSRSLRAGRCGRPLLRHRALRISAAAPDHASRHTPRIRAPATLVTPNRTSLRRGAPHGSPHPSIALLALECRSRSGGPCAVEASLGRQRRAGCLTHSCPPHCAA